MPWVTVSVVVGVDLNANGQLEPLEGVHNLSVRLISVSTNSLLASASTDATGYAILTVQTSAEAVLVMPLLGYAERVRGSETHLTVLLEAVNLPGLIP